MKSEIDKVTYQWRATINSTGRVNAANFMLQRSGPQKRARNKLTPLDIWRQFFSNKIATDISLYTNNRISDIKSELPDEILQNDEYSCINNITESELLGFSYARGFLGQIQLQAKKFSNEISHPIFSATTSYNCMLFIKAVLTFDVPETRQERWKTDRFAGFRSVFERFNEACANNMSRDDYVAADERLYPTRGVILFKTYNKDKTAKYGLNFRSLGSSRRLYVYYTIPYLVKPA